MVFYQMVMEEFCGYGVFGYGTTPIEAILECEKAYEKLAKSYRKYWRGDEEWATFESAITYFGAYVRPITIPSFAIYGRENRICEDEISTILKKERK
jgi:hypothetical protein